MTLPDFKYHKDPVGSEVFEKYSGECPVCSKAQGWKYVGPYYCYEDVENICPWCISSGAAYKKYALSFVDEQGPEKLDDDAKLDELIHRTPGYFSAQGDPWPAHCNDFCKLLGKTSWVEIEPLLSELERDVQTTLENNGLTYEEMVSELKRPHSPLWAHMFVCNKCGKHRFVADYE